MKSSLCTVMAALLTPKHKTTPGIRAVNNALFFMVFIAITIRTMRTDKVNLAGVAALPLADDIPPTHEASDHE